MSKKGIFIPDMDKEGYDAMVKKEKTAGTTCKDCWYQEMPKKEEE